jgi:hypothetical protein
MINFPNISLESSPQKIPLHVPSMEHATSKYFDICLEKMKITVVTLGQALSGLKETEFGFKDKMFRFCWLFTVI